MAELEYLTVARIRANYFTDLLDLIEFCERSPKEDSSRAAAQFRRAFGYAKGLPLSWWHKALFADLRAINRQLFADYQKSHPAKVIPACAGAGVSGQGQLA
ncbi:MAG: hypothetical protein KKB70_05825 [Proteobacteria bacterium]|nr:hypothetical protein [Pseudomonadota bacterium]MBU1610247.1 hypothetical protein [Pseudomonadota bacterium]